MVDAAPTPRAPSGGRSFWAHLHPRALRPRSLRWTTTLGLGMVALHLYGILLLTGLVLMVYYRADAASAYASVQDLHGVVPYGGLVRAMHRWAGHALVAVVGLHLLRVLLTGAYKGRARQGLWRAGLGLLLVTLAFAFTGYLLPWDQLAYWAVSIGGHLAGNVPLLGDHLRRALLGEDGVTGGTLVRFYALHVGILPAMTAVLGVLHLYRLRRVGGLASPEEEGDGPERLPARPWLYEREWALLLATAAAVLIAAMLLPAPLGIEPDPSRPEDPSKAPWYFLWLQELVSYSALWGGVVLPATLLVALYLLPWLDRQGEGSGQWLRPSPAPWVFGLGGLAGLVLVAASLAWHELQKQSHLDSWLNPATLLALALPLAAATTWLAARQRGRPAVQLALVAVAGLTTTAITLLTVVGWLRGPSWTLPFWGGAG